MARNIFEEQSSLDSLVKSIMVDAQDVLRCQRCSVYLIDTTNETVCTFFFFAKHAGTCNILPNSHSLRLQFMLPLGVTVSNRQCIL